jgi:hypothetical protein
MRKLILVPEASGYTSTDGQSSIRIALAGGAGRNRLDKIGASKTVNASWSMNQSEYQYWRSFYRTVTKEGALPFTCDLLSEDGTGVKEHVCSFIPGTVTMPNQIGLNYVQQAQLEVTPLPINEDSDNAVVLIFEITNGDANGWYAALEKLATVTIPQAEAFNA